MHKIMRIPTLFVMALAIGGCGAGTSPGLPGVLATAASRPTSLASRVSSASPTPPVPGGQAPEQVMTPSPTLPVLATTNVPTAASASATAPPAGRTTTRTPIAASTPALTAAPPAPAMTVSAATPETTGAAQTSAPTASATTSAAALATGPWKTLSSPQAGLAIDYPPGWSLEQRPPGYIFAGRDGTAIQLAPVPTGGVSPQQYLANGDLPNSRCQSGPNAHGVTVRICLDTLSGSQVAEFVAAGKGGPPQVWALTTGRRTGDQQVFEAMVASVRPAD